MDNIFTVENEIKNHRKNFGSLNNITSNYGVNNNVTGWENSGTSNNNNNNNKINYKEKLTIKSVIAQTLACFGKYMIMLNVGITATYPMLALPLLRQGSESVRISETEASWLVSAMFIMMPFGCLLSILQVRWGRKVSMISTQILSEISWIILYFANDYNSLLIARALAGIGMTVNQPQVAAYIGEVTVPKVRGALGNATQTMTFVGAVVISLMVPLQSWRNTALICSVFPVLAVVYLCFIPESPVWLMKKRKEKEALRALRWLRGWTSSEAIHEEFIKIKEYCEKAEGKTLKCNANPCFDSHEEISDIPNFSSQERFSVPSVTETKDERGMRNFLRYICKPEMYKPMTLMTVCSFYTSGIGANATYLYDLLCYYSTDFNFDTISLVVTLSLFSGNVLAIVLVPCLKKRRIILISLSSSVCGYALLGYFYLERDNIPLWIIVSVLAWVFFVEGFGLQTLISSLMSEVFPLRGKIFGAAVTGALLTTFAFVASKTYLQLLSQVGVDNTLFTYSGLFFIGFIYFYFCFLETEGKTLAEIEENFKQ